MNPSRPLDPEEERAQIEQLVRATRQIADALGLELEGGFLRVVCDGCGIERALEEEGHDWIHRRQMDFCFNCQFNGQMHDVLSGRANPAP